MLNLSHNQLSSVPREIKKLNKLQTLNLSGEFNSLIGQLLVGQLNESWFLVGQLNELCFLVGQSNKLFMLIGQINFLSLLIV